MKVKIYFKNMGSWIFDFINKVKFEEYLTYNRINILKYEIL